MKEKQVSFPSPRTAGMLTQHKNSLLKLLRGFKHVCALRYIINAVDIFKKCHVVCKKSMCASNRRALPAGCWLSIKILFWHCYVAFYSCVRIWDSLSSFCKPGEQLCNRTSSDLSRSTTKRNFFCISNSWNNNAAMGASECFTLPADRLSKYCLFTKIATRHRNICVEQHFALPSYELS